MFDRQKPDLKKRQKMLNVALYSIFYFLQNEIYSKSPQEIMFSPFWFPMLDNGVIAYERFKIQHKVNFKTYLKKN